MCVKAMNRTIAFVDYQSNKDVDYMKAINKLLKMPKDGKRCMKYFVSWLNEFANTKDFSHEINLPAKFIDTRISVSDKLDEFKVCLSDMNIFYIEDNETYRGSKGKFCINHSVITKCYEQIKVIAKLYHSIDKTSLEFATINDELILPSEIIKTFKDFLPLKDLEVTHDFCIYEDDCEALGLTESDGFNFTYKMDRDDNGDIVYIKDFKATKKLAISIINAYLQKCDSYASFIGETKQYTYDTNQKCFCKIQPSTFDFSEKSKRPSEAVGLYKLHKTLADAILTKHLFKCEVCSTSFIAKRNDASTCSGSCRTEKSSCKRHIKAYLNSQPHTEEV